MSVSSLFPNRRDVPREILRLRKNVQETMLRFGSPVLIKHMYSDLDVKNGVALPSPNFNDVYGQSHHGDPIAHGAGYVSVETERDEWVGPNGDLVTGTTVSPGAGYVLAPKYRGYGPGYLTYAILPDVAEDVFKLTETGALIRVQQAQAQMGWYPEVNDNDLIIVCEIDSNERITATHERYLAKMTNPVSMRGRDRGGRRERNEDFGNRYIINQWFEMTLIPATDPLYNIDVDR